MIIRRLLHFDVCTLVQRCPKAIYLATSRTGTAGPPIFSRVTHPIPRAAAES